MTNEEGNLEDVTTTPPTFPLHAVFAILTKEEASLSQLMFARYYEIYNVYVPNSYRTLYAAECGKIVLV